MEAVVHPMIASSQRMHDSQSETGLPLAKRSDSGLDAGRRLAETFEMLELCLLYLPSVDILLAQRVSKCFRSVINASSRLQRKMFFAPDPAATRTDTKTKLNPLFTSENLQIAIPLFFDHSEKQLTRYHREGRTRLYCRCMSATKVLVHMDLSSEQPVRGLCSTFVEASRRMRTLDDGSWTRMYLSQPSCFLSWRIELRSRSIYASHRDTVYHGCLGELQGESTLGVLLNSLASSSVIEGR
jgi:hypothetical protein